MASPPASYESTAPFVVGSETYHTWYKVFGDLENRTQTPLIALHGGPGLIHTYLSPLASLATTSSIPVILYDQIGNGRSTHLRDKPQSFWTIDLFIDELVNLATHLGIADNFAVLGHSWGGVVGLELAIRRQPAGLTHLIVTNSLASLAMWNQSTEQLMKAFPKEIQEGLSAGMSDPPNYRKALAAFHAVHGCTVNPPPQDFVDAINAIFGEGGDTTVTTALFSGEFGTWSAVDRLDRVNVPTFVINGRADISQDFVNEPFFQRIPKVKWVTLEEASHTPMWEQPERYMSLLADFLKLKF